MADAFLDIRELDTATLRDIVTQAGMVFPEGGDQKSQFFRFRIRRIATEAYRRGVQDGQKLDAAVAKMFSK